MASTNLFPIDPIEHAREERLRAVEDVFSPFAPVALPEFFVGRRQIVADIVSELNAPGRHVVLFGDRGVGKTSLATLIYFFAKRDPEKCHTVRCTANTNFAEIARNLLHDAGALFRPEGRTRSDRKTRAVGTSLGSSSLTIDSTNEHSVNEKSVKSGLDPSVSDLLDVFRDVEGLLIIDEYDRVSDLETHRCMAELLKHFGDARSLTKVLVVGVAQSISQLFGGHESLSRNVAVFRLDRFPDVELNEILVTGEEKLAIDFEPKARDRIIVLSDGYAHYTHLLARYAARRSIDRDSWRPDRRSRVGLDDLSESLVEAIARAEGRLQAAYDSATLTTKRKTQLFQYVIWAIAMSATDEVQLNEIVENLNTLVDTPMKKEQISYHLGKLVLPERSSMLARVRDGIYKFADPLMRGYVRLQLTNYNLLQRKGQISFPFMRQDRALATRQWAPSRPIRR